MATLVTRTVDTVSGGDHTTSSAANAWFETNYPNFVNSDIEGVIEAAGGSDTSAVTCDSVTVGVGNEITFKGEGFGAGKYSLDATLKINVSHANIESLQQDTANRWLELRNLDGVSGLINVKKWFASGTTDSYAAYIRGSNTNVVFENSVFRYFNSRGIYNYGDAGSVVCRNCVGDASDANDGIGYRAFRLTSGDTVTNCIAIAGSSSGFYGSPGGDYNISTDATAPGSNSLTGQVAADLFTAITSSDYTLKLGSNAIGAGADLSAYFTDDINGATRSTWDIGAFYYSTGGGDTTLILADTLHTHSVDNIILGQNHNLSTAATTHAHLADNISLLQQHILSLSDNQHGHTADNLTLLQQQLLSILDAAHGHSADQLSLSQVHNLTVAGADHAHAADSLTLTQNHQLGVNDSLHAHKADNITLLLGELLLAIQSSTHSHTADSLTLQQVHQLSIADALHAHTTDNISLDLSLMLAIADAVHGHTADSITLTQNHILSADDALHTMLADNLALLQDHNITIADALHGHSADNITLFINGLGLGIISDTTVIHLTPQRGKLILTVERSAKHV